jgi:hypothetical protein
MALLLRSLTHAVIVSVALIVELSAARLVVREDKAAETLSVFREGQSVPILTQNAGAEHRPFLHPIAAPDGKGVVTELSPDHHKHQTGIYWGITRLNGRDYFHNRAAGFWRRASVAIVTAAGEDVRWSTHYDLLSAEGKSVLRESQVWSMRETGGRFVLTLEWTGTAKTDVTVSEYAYGGLFVRMPWRKGMEAAALNSNGQRGTATNTQRAAWVAVGLKLEGRDDLAQIAIFDHPRNDGYPTPWRVDGQWGFGPTRASLGSWTIASGRSATFRHQLVIGTGTLDEAAINASWRAFSGEKNLPQPPPAAKQ